MGTRLLKLGSIVGAFLAVWVYALQSGLPEQYRKAVELVPLWALVSFGCYSLCVIGWSLAHFPTCEEDAATLRVEIDKAQKELQARGVLTAADLNGDND